MFTRGIYAILLVSFLLFLAACEHGETAKGKPVTVTLVHTNDFHSQFEPLHPENEPEQGGAARNMTLINNIRKEKGEDNVLLLSGGDNFQGTMFYNAWKGSAEVMLMNHMRYDAACMGNHEFDSGSDQLGRALRGGPIAINGKTYPTEAARFIALGTNIDDSAEPALNSILVNRAVIEKSGNRYGLLGVTTESTANGSSPGKNVKFLDYVAAVQKQADLLKREGVDKIILLSHTGTEEDAKRAPQLSGIDVIVAGHDHALLGDADAIRAMGLPAHADRVKGPYPIVTKDKDGNNVLIVSAMEKGRWLGRVDITFDENGHIADGAWKAAPIFVRGCTKNDCSQEVAKPDAALAAKIAEYNAPIEAYSNQVVGEASTRFAGRHSEGANVVSMGDLVADILLAYTRKSDRSDAAWVNRGGMRADLEKGTVRYKDINTVLPFENHIVVIEMAGHELVKAMDNAVSEANGESYGAFPHVSNMKVRHCAALPCAKALHKGGLVTSITVNGKKLDMKAHYRIATNNYLARGGDFYSDFKTACERKNGYCRHHNVLLKDVVADWFRQHSPVGPVTGGRVAVKE